MNIKRSIAFSLLLYIGMMVLIGLLSLLPFFDVMNLTLSAFAVMWVLLVPLVLLLAKWFYKQVEPTVKNGFYLGLIALVVGGLLDGIAIFVMQQMGVLRDPIIALYRGPLVYMTFFEILLLTTFAGGEFDATYSPEA